ncbi:MAG TPA: FAD-dependent monooxygenase, partial [Myxococcaceae bacterium]|nr:FAD-dependent monooxygenase [Myxococcaceae bacterium]
MSRTRVTVIGGGVSGLTCGVVLQEAGFQVRIVARERWPRTVSA